jgi:hypothetical protein
MMYLTDEDYETAEKNGLKKATVHNRFYHLGWSKERSISAPFKVSLYEQHEEDCKENGVSYDLFYSRRAKGMTSKQAATTPVKKPKLTDKDFEVAASNGIGRLTVKARVHNYRWTVERAITEPIHQKFRKKD